MLNIIWELKQGNVFFAAFWQLVLAPYRAYRLLTRHSQRLFFHEYITHVCKGLHVEGLANRIEATRFKNANSHEAEVSNFLLKTKGKLFIDVGANVGRYAILLSENYEKVLAFEPYYKNVLSLKRNLKAVHIKNVDVVPIAISNINDMVKLTLGSHCGGHTILGEVGKSVPIPCCRLDFLFPHVEIDLVKVDVEGAEWLVLEGAEKIVDSIHSWLIELHDPKRKAELEAWFSIHGYKFQWLTGNHVFGWRKQE